MDWSRFDSGVYLVNVLAVIYNPKARKILIGRREKDPYVKELTWCFPGGRPSYKEDLEFYLKEAVREKTNLDIEVKKIVFAKTYPEKREFLSIYYLAEVTGGEEKPGDKFVEIKWVNPHEIKDYFTTSIHPKLLEYLKTLT